MGEIIFSICVGGFLALSGVVLNVVLTREEKRNNIAAKQAPKGQQAAPKKASGTGGTDL